MVPINKVNKEPIDVEIVDEDSETVLSLMKRSNFKLYGLPLLLVCFCIILYILLGLNDLMNHVVKLDISWIVILLFQKVFLIVLYIFHVVMFCERIMIS